MTGLIRAAVGMFLALATMAVATVYVVSILGYHIETRIPLFFVMFAGILLAAWFVTIVAVRANLTTAPSLGRVYAAAPRWARVLAVGVALNAVGNLVALSMHKETKWHVSDGHYFVRGTDDLDREVSVAFVNGEIDYLVRSTSGIVLWFYYVMWMFVWFWPNWDGRGSRLT